MKLLRLNALYVYLLQHFTIFLIKSSRHMHAGMVRTTQPLVDQGESLHRLRHRR